MRAQAHATLTQVHGELEALLIRVLGASPSLVPLARRPYATWMVRARMGVGARGGGAGRRQQQGDGMRPPPAESRRPTHPLRNFLTHALAPPPPPLHPPSMRLTLRPTP